MVPTIISSSLKLIGVLVVRISRSNFFSQHQYLSTILLSCHTELKNWRSHNHLLPLSSICILLRSCFLNRCTIDVNCKYRSLYRESIRMRIQICLKIRWKKNLWSYIWRLISLILSKNCHIESTNNSEQVL